MWEFNPEYWSWWLRWRYDWIAANTTFSLPQSLRTRLGQPSASLTLSKKIVPTTNGSLFEWIVFNHIILRLYPPIQPWMWNSNGFNLSYPSKCQQKFVPWFWYCLRFRFRVLQLTDPSGSSCFKASITASLGTNNRGTMIISAKSIYNLNCYSVPTIPAKRQ